MEHEAAGQSQSRSRVIDAALRFARSNPELVAYARAHAAELQVPVDDLLRSAIQKVAEGRQGLEPEQDKPRYLERAR